MGRGAVGLGTLRSIDWPHNKGELMLPIRASALKSALESIPDNHRVILEGDAINCFLLVDLDDSANTHTVTHKPGMVVSYVDTDVA
jgi:hypothetical protein